MPRKLRAQLMTTLRPQRGRQSRAKRSGVHRRLLTVAAAEATSRMRKSAGAKSRATRMLYTVWRTGLKLGVFDRLAIGKCDESAAVKDALIA